LVRSLESEAKVAGARLETLSSNLEQFKRQTASTSDQDVQLRALEREAKAQRDLFESYLAKYREATARDSIAAAPADARIISRAVVTNVPYFPKKMPIMLIAAFGTFCLATAFVVTGALLGGDNIRQARRKTDPNPEARFEPVVRSADARSRASDRLPAAPTLPQTVNVPPISVPQAPPIAPVSVLPPGLTVDDVVAALHQAGEAGRCVAVIGSARNVGTTLTAIALARTISLNARVVLVDLAFASPNIDVISNDPDAPGMAELVRGLASFGDIITRDRGSRTHVVSAGQVGNDAEGLLQSQMLWAAVGALAQSYDYLVLDAGVPSELMLAGLAATAPYAVLVGGDTAAPALDALASRLQQAGFGQIAVLTGPPPPFEEAAAQSAA
jgi:polysaccharide biosynthesis transport protein